MRPANIFYIVYKSYSKNAALSSNNVSFINKKGNILPLRGLNLHTKCILDLCADICTLNLAALRSAFFIVFCKKQWEAEFYPPPFSARVNPRLWATFYSL